MVVKTLSKTCFSLERNERVERDVLRTVTADFTLGQKLTAELLQNRVNIFDSLNQALRLKDQGIFMHVSMNIH
jgi:hypothetical protein